MSRCSICDYSQSADSTYHNSLHFSKYAPNNRVVYHKALDRDICLSCLDDYTHDKNYWTDVDGIQPDFNAFIPEDDEVLEYQGCTEKPGD